MKVIQHAAFVLLLFALLAPLPGGAPVAAQESALPPDIARQVEGCLSVAVGRRRVTAAGCPGPGIVMIRLDPSRPDLPCHARAGRAQTRPRKCLTPLPASPVEPGPVRAPSAGSPRPSGAPALRVALECTSGAETTTITNVGPGAVTVQSIRSIYKPAPGESIPVGRTLREGEAVVVITGPNVAEAERRSADIGPSAVNGGGKPIYRDEAGGEEGVAVTTDRGRVTQLCPDL